MRFLDVGKNIIDLSKVSYVRFNPGRPVTDQASALDPECVICMDNGKELNYSEPANLSLIREAWINYLSGGQLMGLR